MITLAFKKKVFVEQVVPFNVGTDVYWLLDVEDTISQDIDVTNFSTVFGYPDLVLVEPNENIIEIIRQHSVENNLTIILEPEEIVEIPNPNEIAEAYIETGKVLYLEYANHDMVNELPLLFDKNYHKNIYRYFKESPSINTVIIAMDRSMPNKFAVNLASSDLAKLEYNNSMDTETNFGLVKMPNDFAGFWYKIEDCEYNVKFAFINYRSLYSGYRRGNGLCALTNELNKQFIFEATGHSKESEFSEFINHKINKAIQRSDDIIKQTQAELESMFTIIAELQSNYLSVSKQKELLMRQKRQDAEERKDLYNSLLMFKEVTAYTVDYPTLKIRTIPLIARDPRYNTLHMVGEYEITINANSGSILFKNMWGRVAFNQGLHIFSDGNACLGNLKSELPALIAEGDLENAVAYILSFLVTANVDDSFGNRIAMYPLVPYQDITKIDVEKFNKKLKLLTDDYSYEGNSGLFTKGCITQEFLCQVMSKYYGVNETPNMPLYEIIPQEEQNDNPF